MPADPTPLASDTEPDATGLALRRFADPAYRPLAGNLQQLRDRIDQFDDAIVALIAQRAMYVKDAARFKANPRQVAAPARQAQVYRHVRDLADRHNAGFDGLADVVEAVYRAMVPAFIAQEARYYDQLVRVDDQEKPLER